MLPRSDDPNPEVDAVLSSVAKFFYLEERWEGADPHKADRKARERAFQGCIVLLAIKQPELLGKGGTAVMYEVIDKAIKEAQVWENTVRKILEGER